jgi:hypothetical protein
MRRVLFGLTLILPMMCSIAFAGDASNADSNGSQKMQKPSPSAQIRRLKNNKQVPRTQSELRSGPRSLSSAAAYASEHSATLPISSVPKSTPPPTNSWTGFHVGVGAGVGATQP